MTTINTLPYRIAIRESGSTRAVTDWLESKISPDCWKVELLDVEEYDDENRKIHYVIRFRYQTDLQRFRTAFLNKSKKGFAGRPSGGDSGHGGRHRAGDSWVRLTAFAAFWRLLLNPDEEVYIRKRTG